MAFIIRPALAFGDQLWGEEFDVKRIWEGVKSYFRGCSLFAASTVGGVFVVYILSRVFGVYMGLSRDGSANMSIDPLHLPLWAELITIAAWGVGGWAGSASVAHVLRRRWPIFVEAPILALCAVISLLLTHPIWAVAASAAAVLAVGAYVFATFKARRDELELRDDEALEDAEA
jgi:hypothetical protein